MPGVTVYKFKGLHIYPEVFPANSCFEKFYFRIFAMNSLEEDPAKQVSTR